MSGAGGFRSFGRTDARRAVVSGRGRAALAFAAIVAIVAIVLVIAARNSALYPVVMSDEYRYSVAARLEPFAESSVPNYLFLVVYRATNLCGDAFLGCGRWLNLAFFAAATPFIDRVARRVLSRPIAAVVAGLALVSPFSTYTAYFMPESMYYFGFWWLVSLVVAMPPAASAGRYAIVGVALGLLALVKPHALFLMPPVVVFLVVEAWRSKLVRGGSIAIRATVVLAVAFAVKFAIGYAIAGRPALTLFGSFYSGIASTAQSTGVEARVAGLSADVVRNLSGHAMALALLFALPLAVLASSIVGWRTAAASPAANERRRLALLSALVPGTLIVVAALFTVAVEGQGPYETLYRLHARYYDFAFPLLMIVGASTIDDGSSTRWLRPVVAVAVAAVIACGVFTGLRSFDIGLIDYPELQGVTAHSAVKHVVALLGIASLALWVARPRYAALCFVLAVMPFAMLKGSAAASEQLHTRRTADVYDTAGSVARHLLSRDDAAHATVLGDDAAGVYHTLFQLDAASARATLVTTGATIGSRDWPASSPWAIVVGDHRLDGIDADRTDHDGFVLLHRRPVPR